MPTFPIFLNPRALIPSTKILPPKHSQNVAPYASINISVALSALPFSESVVLDATTAVIASPTEFPMLEIVLNTPPARPWVFGRKTDVISRFATVNNTSAQIGAHSVAKNA